MKLFVVRHGESQTNREYLVGGRTDVSLSERGMEQANALAEKLVTKGIDLIISSPLKRARQTAELANAIIRVPILFDDRLMELNFGTFERTSARAPAFRKLRNSFAGRFPQGESTCRVIQRVFNMLDEVTQTYADQTVLLVTHNVTSKSINAYCCTLTDEEFHDFRLENCELKEYALD